MRLDRLEAIVFISIYENYNLTDINTRLDEYGDAFSCFCADIARSDVNKIYLSLASKVKKYFGGGVVRFEEIFKLDGDLCLRVISMVLRVTSPLDRINALVFKQVASEFDYDDDDLDMIAGKLCIPAGFVLPLARAWKDCPECFGKKQLS